MRDQGHVAPLPPLPHSYLPHLFVPPALLLYLLVLVHTIPSANLCTLGFICAPCTHLMLVCPPHTHSYPHAHLLLCCCCTCCWCWCCSCSFMLIVVMPIVVIIHVHSHPLLSHLLSSLLLSLLPSLLLLLLPPWVQLLGLGFIPTSTRHRPGES